MKLNKMRLINNNNRYYCHSKLLQVNASRKRRIIFLPYDTQLNKYIKRLVDVYNYSLQFTIPCPIK